METTKYHHPFVWAHRGASGYETDNTFESFDLAFEQGADGIESDVRTSRDGLLFFFHDDYIVANGKKVKPETLTFAELKEIDLGNGRRMPGVEETFRRYRDARTVLGAPVMYSLDIQPISVGVRLARLAGELEMSHRVVITPSDVDHGFRQGVEEIRDCNPDILLVRTAGYSFIEQMVKLLPGRDPLPDWERMKHFGFTGVNLQARQATDKRLRQIREWGFQTYVWDCHDTATMKKFVDKKVDAMYTNYPDRLIEHLGT